MAYCLFKPSRAYIMLKTFTLKFPPYVYTAVRVFFATACECDCFSFFRPAPIVLAEGQVDGQTASAQEDQPNVAQVQPASADLLHNGALVFCNPGASGIEDADPENPKSHEGENQDAKASEESRESEEEGSGMCLRIIHWKLTLTTSDCHKRC